MSARRHVVLMVLATIGAATGLTHAMSLAPAPLEQLVEEADLVVHGLVLTATAEPEPNHPHHLRTRHQLVVWEHLKAPRVRGDDPHSWATTELEVLELLQPGGRSDALQTLVPGIVPLHPGDEVVLLLSRTPWGLQPLGYPMGTFFVDAAGAVVPAWPGHQAQSPSGPIEATLRGQTP